MSWVEVQGAPVLRLAPVDTMKSKGSTLCPETPGEFPRQPLLQLCFTRLVLPFERHMKGEEDKPLPPSKPRKPYKRNLDGKVHKAEKKRKPSHSDREMDAEVTSRKALNHRKYKRQPVSHIVLLLL